MTALKTVSIGRLACLVRHWAWADEAMARFERELADGLEYDEDLATDHPFGSYYHWCALMSGFVDAAQAGQLLSTQELAAIRDDIEGSVEELRACRDILLEIPSSLETHPLVVHLLQDGEKLSRLRRLHQAFGDAIRRERAWREIALLDD